MLISIEGQLLKREDYSYSNSILSLNEKNCNEHSGKRILISYRYLDLPLDRSYSLFDSTLARQKDVIIYIGSDLIPDYQKGDEVIQSKSLNYNGSLTRGFSLGNAQSLVLNSKFDMQLEGDIGNGIKIRAAITDDNIPIQPEGNTQVLQEFDRVFIELSKNATSVVAGDYTINRPESYFMNYLKKLKGIGINNETRYKNKTIKSAANVASSRGKFSRQTLPTKEGNQGPYKINGNNNERFIIILSGTEKIYFNGELLKRGFDLDYAIDYNLAEITFSTNRLIAKETRVIIEFEYTDLNYFRTLYTANTSYQSDKTKVVFNFYSEQDSKKSTGQIELDSTSINLLEGAGDVTANYNVLSIRKLEQDNVDNIKYELLPNPNFPSDKNQFYLQYSADVTKELYTANFSEVGTNKGSYSIDVSQGLNGRIYKFVGENKGNYEPFNQLIPPESKQMTNLMIEHQFGRYGKLTSDVSMSNFDKNKFSAIDDGDNIGVASYFKFEDAKVFKHKTKYNPKLDSNSIDSSKLTKTKQDSTIFTYGVSMESLNKFFNILNQYRSSEFYRDWNYFSAPLNKENILSAKLGIHRDLNNFNVTLNNFQTGNGFKGNRLIFDIQYQKKGFKITGYPSITQTKTNLYKSNFLRPNFIVTQQFKKLDNIIFGISLEAEKNTRDILLDNSLDSTSYSFYYTKAFLSTNTERDVSFKISYNKREDQYSNKINLSPVIDINEYELGSIWQVPKISNLDVSVKLRDFKVVNEALVRNDKSKLTLLSNINHSLTILNKGITTNTIYQVNSGQEPKLEYVFQKVENLRGDYVYVGADTVSIKNINDFKYDPSNPLASYVRFVVPNNEFITTNNLLFNQSLRIEPSQFIKRDSLPLSKMKKFVTRFSSISNLKLSNKLSGNTANFDFFNFNTKDTSLIAYNKTINTSLFFNRGNPKYDLSFIHNNQGVKNNQINGFEERENLDNEWKVRYNFLKNADLFLSINEGEKNFNNQLYLDRNFQIDYTRYNAEVSFRYSTKLRIAGKYSYGNNQQQINNRERALKNELTLNINKRSANASNIDVNISFIKIKYEGEANSLIAYDLLDGLKGGDNYLWSVHFTRRLSKLIDLIVSYEGRKTGGNSVVNVARMEAKANF